MLIPALAITDFIEEIAISFDFFNEISYG
jgi:hypothetical protein